MATTWTAKAKTEGSNYILMQDESYVELQDDSILVRGTTVGIDLTAVDKQSTSYTAKAKQTASYTAKEKP